MRLTNFNIRNSGAADGDDAWPLRRDLCIETIRANEPDVLGLQEVLADQADFIRERLPDYGFVGVGRDDGDRAGEFAPVLFRSDRFDLVDAGHRWLSTTPTVASFGWDAACVRIVTWVTLRDRAMRRVLLVANTHWDHEGTRARIESAYQIRRLITERSRESSVSHPLPAIVMGDFNCTEDDEPYAVLVGSDGAPLIDTYRAAHPRPHAEELSCHWFKGSREGKRIDWILCSRDFTVSNASIDRRSNANGRFPSDHYPVNAEVIFDVT